MKHSAPCFLPLPLFISSPGGGYVLYPTPLSPRTITFLFDSLSSLVQARVARLHSLLSLSGTSSSPPVLLQFFPRKSPTDLPFPWSSCQPSSLPPSPSIQFSPPPQTKRDGPSPFPILNNIIINKPFFPFPFLLHADRCYTWSWTSFPRYRCQSGKSDGDVDGFGVEGRG